MPTSHRKSRFSSWEVSGGRIHNEANRKGASLQVCVSVMSLETLTLNQAQAWRGLFLPKALSSYQLTTRPVREAPGPPQCGKDREPAALPMSQTRDQ